MIPLGLNMEAISRMTQTRGDSTVYHRVSCESDEGVWFDFDEEQVKRLACGVRLSPGFNELMKILYRELVYPEVVAKRLMRSS